MNPHSPPVVRTSVILLMFFQVAALFVRAFLQREITPAGGATEPGKSIAMIAGLMVLVFLLWPVFLRERRPLARMLKRPQSWPRLIACSVLLGLCIRLLWWCGVVAAITFGLLGPGDPAGAAGPVWWWTCPAPSVVAWMVLALVLLTPLFEEVVSRGLILNALLRRNRYLGIFGSALLFAILHDPSGIPYAFLFGVVAAIQMIHYRTLWGPIIAHVTANALLIVDWYCLHGLWIPAETSVALGIIAGTLGLTCFSLALLLARAEGAGTS